MTLATRLLARHGLIRILGAVRRACRRDGFAEAAAEEVIDLLKPDLALFSSVVSIGIICEIPPVVRVGSPARQDCWSGFQVSNRLLERFLLFLEMLGCAALFPPMSCPSKPARVRVRNQAGSPSHALGLVADSVAQIAVGVE